MNFIKEDLVLVSYKPLKNSPRLSIENPPQWVIDQLTLNSLDVKMIVLDSRTQKILKFEFYGGSWHEVCNVISKAS
jgi:hypothetical protein